MVTSSHSVEYTPLGKLIYTTDFPPFVSTLPSSPKTYTRHILLYIFNVYYKCIRKSNKIGSWSHYKLKYSLNKQHLCFCARWRVVSIPFGRCKDGGKAAIKICVTTNVYQHILLQKGSCNNFKSKQINMYKEMEYRYT